MKLLDEQSILTGRIKAMRDNLEAARIGRFKVEYALWRLDLIEVIGRPGAVRVELDWAENPEFGYLRNSEVTLVAARRLRGTIEADGRQVDIALSCLEFGSEWSSHSLWGAESP